MGSQALGRAVRELFEFRSLVTESHKDESYYRDILDGIRRVPEAYEEVLAYVALRGAPELRAIALEEAIENPNSETAQNYIAWQTHDPEDWISFRAIRACGELKLETAVRDLFSIIGALSHRLQPGAGKPVGVGHALVMEALQSIIGSHDLGDIVDFENRYFDTESSPPEISERTDRERGIGMVLVPAHSARIGLDQRRFPWHFFDCSDTPVEHEVNLGSFLIDRGPVTSAQYDAFCSAVEDGDHEVCHPDEVPDKDHRRNTIRDPRFSSDAPVAGIDWFDAYAFAAWSGKRLPTEQEWEAAARGPTGEVFPWGDTFEAARCRCASQAFNTNIDTLDEWRTLLTRARDDYPTTTVIESSEDDQGNAYGLQSMVGNVWEWTATSFTTHDLLQPQTRGRTSSELAFDPNSLAVIKGGAWSSFADLLVPAYRGKDLIVDRHNEIGFRCVLDPNTLEPAHE
jgi:gamma-glutamyl hercynylcysteine S-oxide synthase